MSSRERVQRAREASREAVKSFEETFKEVDRLVDQNASDADIDAAIAESGIPQDAFIDAYTRYNKAGGVVDFGVGRSLLQGLSFGFADEIEASLPSAVTGLEGDFEQRVGQIRAGQTAFEAARPEEAMGAELIGALPTALIPGGLAARGAMRGGASLAGTMARGAGVGAAEGALAEAGRGETMAERISRATTGGIIGGGVGALAPLATTGASAALRAGRPVEQTALSQMSRALPEERMDDIAGRVAERVETGATSPLTLAEMGGRTAQRELRGLRGGSADVEELVAPRLEARMAQQGQRIEEAAESAVGMGPESSVVLGNVVRTQESAAAPLYKAIREQYPTVSVRGMEDVFERESFREAYPRIMRSVMEEKRGEIPDEILNKTPRTYEDFMRMLRESGDVEVPFDFLDQAKQVIGSMGNAAARSGDNNLARLRYQTAETIKDATDRRVPEYRQAREVFAGEAAIEDAMESGTKFERMTPAEVRQTIANMNESERQAFITGAVDQLRLKIGEAGTGRDLVKSLKLEVPFQRQRLAAIMGGEDSPAFQAFEKAVREEAEMAQTRGIVMGGSQTAAFQRDIQGADLGFDDMVDLLMNPASVTNVGALSRMFRGLLNRYQGSGGQTGQRVAEMLTETSPAAQQRIVEGVQRSRESARRSAAMTAGAGVTAAGAAAQGVTGLLGED